MSEKYSPQFTDKQQGIVSNLVNDLSQIEGVIAVALGGSFASGKATATSDIDIGIYYRDASPFLIDAIREIAEKYTDEPNPTVTGFGDWGRWVNGGAWLTIDGQRVDFLYRSVDTLQEWIGKSKSGVIELDYYQQPVTGFYSYMYLAELNICVPLYDEIEKLAALKAQIETYPPQLKAKIIEDFSWMAEFTLYHAEVAAKRGDTYSLVGCLHRIVACIVQIIYAKNERYFLSDKGAIAECATLEHVPDDFTETIEDILTNPSSRSIEQIKLMLNQLSSR